MMTHVFSSTEFRDLIAGTPKWDLVIQAIDKGRANPKPYARSLGSTLTYWTECARAGGELTAARMYQTFLVPLGGPAWIDVAETSTLHPYRPYDDTRDSQTFSGEAERVEIPEGSIVAVPPNAAWRYADSSESVPVMRLRVTRAGVPLRLAEQR